MSSASSLSDREVNRTIMDEIQPGFWVGGCSALKEIPHVQTRKSDDAPKWTIVSLVHTPKLVTFCRLAVAQLKSHPKLQIEQHVEWAVEDKVDSPLLCPRLEHVLTVMDQALGHDHHHLLVHCAMGVSRSVSVCAAWLLSRQGVSLEVALQRIRAARPEAMPNLGFVANLRTLEQCQGDVAKAIARQNERRAASDQLTST